MIPFAIFLGICSSGLLFMLYFLVGFWREDRRRSQPRQNAAIRIPSMRLTPIGRMRQVPDFSSASTAMNLIEEPEYELHSNSMWQVFVNPARLQARRVR
jgi:hypothetical protein